MKISVINPMVPLTPLGYVPVAAIDSVRLGLSKIGYEVVRMPSKSNPVTKKVVVWGWKNYNAKVYRRRGKDVLVLELGYIGNRREYISVGLNGLNNYATFPEYPEDGGRRFRAHGGILKPWKYKGEYILILGQVKGDASLKGLDITSWYQRMAAEAERVHKLPVFFRPHPESFRRRGYTEIPGLRNLGGSLDEAISGAKFTISYNSNSSLDSIMQGVPSVAGDKGTMAWDLCSKSVEDLKFLKREPVVHRIAWCQWSFEEIKSGEPLVKILDS